MDPKIETRSLVWELLNETTGEVLRTSPQTVEEFGLHACGPELALACVDAIPRSALDAEDEDTIIIPDALTCAGVIPKSMLQSANAGEWSRDGLLFEHNGKKYLVRCRVTAREENEEIVHDPIPEPLSLGVGVSIDMVSDHMDSPTWYVGVYDGTGDWLGEVPTRMDPMRTSLAEIDELAVSVARYILHEYPRCVVGVDEIARRIRMVLRTARVGAPRSYPEIEREEGA